MVSFLNNIIHYKIAQKARNKARQKCLFTLFLSFIPLLEESKIKYEEKEIIKSLKLISWDDVFVCMLKEGMFVGSWTS